MTELSTFLYTIKDASKIFKLLQDDDKDEGGQEWEAY